MRTRIQQSCPAATSSANSRSTRPSRRSPASALYAVQPALPQLSECSRRVHKSWPHPILLKWKGNTLIRLLVPDKGSAQPFSKKFGAPLPWVSEIAARLQDAQIPLRGWSFHVGSVCGDAGQYRKAIEVCAEASALVKKHAEIVDIGGGFVADPALFGEAAAALTKARHFFPPTTQWIGEPGRFFASPAATLRVQVSGVKRGLEPGTWRYTLDESIYGAFSNIPFDGFKLAFRFASRLEEERAMMKATIYGRTCDSADLIAENVVIPELRVGDWLCVDNMGAYTIVSGSEFNGFKKPRRIYAT